MHLRFTTAGESHGQALVAIVEGLPAGLPVSAELGGPGACPPDEGYGRGARMKIERDRIEWLAGVRAGETLGSPVAMLIRNRDWANWADVMGRRGGGRRATLRRRRVTRPRARATPTWPGCSSTTGSTRATSWSAPARGRPRPGSPPAPWPAGCSTSSACESAATSWPGRHRARRAGGAARRRSTPLPTAPRSGCSTRRRARIIAPDRPGQAGGRYAGRRGGGRRPRACSSASAAT